MNQLNITKEQYIKLRQSGMSQEEIAEKYKAGQGTQRLMDAGTAVTNFFGGSKVAETFGSELARLRTKDPTQRQYLEQTAPTVKQTAGSALALGSLFTPVGGLAGGITAGAKAVGISRGAALIGNVGAGALTGYAYDVGTKLADNAEKPYKPGIATALGAAIPAVGTGVSWAVNSLASKTPQAQMYKMTELSSVKNAFDEASVYKYVNGKRTLVRDPITTLSRDKIIPQVQNSKIDVTQAQELVRSKIDGLAELNKKAVERAVEQNVKAPVVQLQADIEAAIRSNKRIKASGSVQKTLSKVQAMLDDFRMSYGDDIPADAVDAIRVEMNKVWNPDEVNAARAIGDAVRKFQYDNMPGTQDLLRKEGEYLAAIDFLQSLHGKAVTGGRLGRYFADLIGAIAGSTLNIPVAGPVIGALGARALANRVAQTYFKPIGSTTARKVVGAASELTTPGDMFLKTRTGQSALNYAKNIQPGLSVKSTVPAPQNLAKEITAGQYKKIKEYLAAKQKGVNAEVAAGTGMDLIEVLDDTGVEKLKLPEKGPAPSPSFSDEQSLIDYLQAVVDAYEAAL